MKTYLKRRVVLREKETWTIGKAEEKVKGFVSPSKIIEKKVFFM